MFKIDDRVIATADGGVFFKKGNEGTVVRVSGNLLDVQWDEPHYESGRWFVDQSNVAILSRQYREPVDVFEGAMADAKELLDVIQNSGYPDNNPKTAIGVTKVPLHLVPPSAKHFLGLALADGARKYGAYNWRDHAISISVYKAAAERHLDAFWDGEDLAPDSQVHHVAHAMACCALILDALTIGKLNDDRPAKGAAPQLQVEYATKGK